LLTGIPAKHLIIPDLELALFYDFSWKFWLHFEFPDMHLRWINKYPVLVHARSMLKFLPSSAKKGCIMEVYGDEESAAYFSESFAEWKKLQPKLPQHFVRACQEGQWVSITASEKIWMLKS
jgi:hypothetical protein